MARQHSIRSRGTGRSPLPRSFYVRPTEEVAPDLLGKVLAHRTPEGVAAGRIVEVEAYLGPDDPASHAHRGPRGRAWVMFEEGGRAYVYFSYGVHWCVNVVTDRKGAGGAVLIRALEPVEGTDLMRRRRARNGAGREPRSLCSGPGKLTQALAIGRELNGADLVAGDSPLVVLPGDAPAAIEATPRVGISKAKERLLRFCERGSAFLSRR